MKHALALVYTWHRWLTLTLLHGQHVACRLALWNAGVNMTICFPAIYGNPLITLPWHLPLIPLLRKRLSSGTFAVSSVLLLTLNILEQTWCRRLPLISVHAQC